MAYEKVPEKYDQKSIQKLVDQLQRDQARSEQRQITQTRDLAVQAKRAFRKLNQKLTEKTSPADTDQAFQSFTIPAPQNLKVYELITWGFATVSPWERFKYWGKIKGYEFFGSLNENFTPQENDYVEDGTFVDYFTSPTDPLTKHIGAHKGTGTLASPDLYLNTEDTTTPEASFIFHPNLNTGNIILENTTRSARGNIDTLQTDHLLDATNDFALITVGMPVQNVRLDTWTTVTNVAAGDLTLDDDIFTEVGESYLVGAGKIPVVLGYNPLARKYQVGTAGVKWVAGDRWRIHDYPANKLPSIGAYATFVKRPGNFYVRARTIGKGDTYSDFAPPMAEAPEQSTGLSSSEDLSTPVFVQPVHTDGTTCPIETNDADPDYGKPIHPSLGAVEWSDIASGCRETDHLKFFGFEWCNVELVYNTIPEDDDETDVFYNVVRTGALWGSPTVDEDEDESELS
jgi:hypothetical protein